MPFRSGSLTVRRFLIQGDVPETLSRTATMAMRRYGYRPIDPARGEKEAFGWVNPRRPLDETFTWDDVKDGNLVFLAVRRDRKSFSKVLYRARLEERLEDVKKERGLERVTRQHRLALQDELSIQMLSEVTPTVSFTELVWDLNSGEVLLGTTAKSLCERVMDLFASTFDLRLLPQFPALLGYSLLAQQGLEEQFDRVSASVPDGGNGAGQSMDAVESDEGGAT